MTEIPIIALSPEFYKLILNKKKTTTIRSGHRDYPLGDAILNWGEDYSRITISKIEYKPFKELTQQEAESDGFLTLDELKKTLLRFYPSLLPDSEVSVIYFNIKE